MEHLVVCSIIESGRPNHLISREYEGDLLMKTAQAFVRLHNDLKEHKWADCIEIKYLKRVNGKGWSEPKPVVKGRKEAFPFLISTDVRSIERELVETMTLSPEDLGEPSLLLGATTIHDFWHVQKNDDHGVYDDDLQAAEANFSRVKFEYDDVFAAGPKTKLALWCIERLTSQKNMPPPASPESWMAIRLSDQERQKRSNYALPGLVLELEKLKEHYPGYLKGVTVINSIFFHVEAVEVAGDPLEAVHENNREFFLNVCGLGFSKFSTIEHGSKRYVVVITPFGD